MRTTATKLASFVTFTLAACAALHVPQAAAQPRSAERCTTIDNDAERLACYDRALRPAAAPAPSTAIATENRATRPAREVRESTVSAAPAAPAAPAAAAARQAPAASKEEAVGVVPIVIVQIRTLPGRAATFVTDTGDTWVQTDTQRQMPAVPFKAEIKAGSMGSSFLVPDDYARSFRVRRGQ
ncbi:MAG: hypothetical protein ABI640_08165 [Gammaproteobacteria bacterium]